MLSLDYKYTERVRSEIVNERATWFIKKSNKKLSDAMIRAQEVVMNNDQFNLFVEMALKICDKLGVVATKNRLHMSTNRYGGHSWYINYKTKLQIRISDHRRKWDYDNTLTIDIVFKYNKWQISIKPNNPPLKFVFKKHLNIEDRVFLGKECESSFLESQFFSLEQIIHIIENFEGIKMTLR